MPRRYGGSPQPRGYGGYSSEASYAYQAEAEPPAWLTGLTEAVGGYMTVNGARKAREQEQADKFTTMNNNIKGQMMLANADIESAFVKQEENQREAKLAAEKQSVLADLAQRFTGGDASAGARLASMGMPAATINALKPEQKKPDPEDPEDVTYRRTKGRLRAEKELNAGAFKPKPAGAPKPTMTSTELRRRALEAIRTHTGTTIDLVPGASATTVIRSVMDDPSYADVVGDPTFGRSLMSLVTKELNDERQRRAPKGGAAKGGMGARAAAMNPKK